MVGCRKPALTEGTQRVAERVDVLWRNGEFVVAGGTVLGEASSQLKPTMRRHCASSEQPLPGWLPVGAVRRSQALAAV
jgi:hypothetical protein